MSERRAPVLADGWRPPRAGYRRPAGTIAWTEHESAWADYARRYGLGQSAERVAERGGFGYAELTDHLGHEPTTWEPRT